MKLIPRAPTAERVRAGVSSYRDPGTYYVDGYMMGTFRPGAALDRLNATIARIQQPELQPPFTWKEKYDRTQDLRPSVYEYDTSFVDVLFESAIPSLLKRVTGFDLFLAHIQLRRVFPGKSYGLASRYIYLRAKNSRELTPSSQADLLPDERPGSGASASY